MITKLIEEFKQAQAQNLITKIDVYPEKPAGGYITTVFVALKAETPQTVREKLIESIKSHYQCSVTTFQDGTLFVYKEPL